MSFYTYYQAIPEKSRLFTRLRSDPTFCRLYTGLIPYGPGPFHLELLDPAELDDILNDFVGVELMKSRSDVDKWRNDLTAELADMVAIHPGLRDRWAYIEKLHDEIEGAIVSQLGRSASVDNLSLMKELLYGGEALAPEFFRENDRQLYLVPFPTVAEGEKLFATIGLFEEHGVSDYACEQYQGWKDLILEAARRGESILVYPTG